MKTKTLTVLAAMIAASALLTACGAPAHVAVIPTQENVAENMLPAVEAEVLDFVSPATPLAPTATQAPAPAAREPIGMEMAKAIVFAALGLTEAQLTDKDYELDRGVYELEFTANGLEYEYKVDAFTGEILKAHSEPDDDRREPTAPAPTEPAPTAPVTPTPTEPAPTEPTLLTREEIKAIVFAQLEISEAQVYRLEIELDDGKYDLEFHVGSTEYDVEVNARSGKILKVEKEQEKPAPTAPVTPTPTEPAPTAPAPTEPTLLTREEIKAIVFAQLEISEAQVSRLDIELDDGKYDLEFHVGSTEYDVEVNARSGKILKVEKEKENEQPSAVPEVPKTDSILSPEQVKQLIFAKLGITEDQAKRMQIELDEGKYELEFTVGRFEYECEVDARTGKILEIDKEADD